MRSRDRMNHAIDSTRASYGCVCLTTIVTLVCITPKTAASGLYRCLDPFGIEIFTDSPAQLAACTAMQVGAAPPTLKSVPSSERELEAVKDGPRTDTADEVHNGIAILPDSDAPSIPSVGSDTPNAPASSSDSGVP